MRRGRLVLRSRICHVAIVWLSPAFTLQNDGRQKKKQRNPCNEKQEVADINNTFVEIRHLIFNIELINRRPQFRADEFRLGQEPRAPDRKTQPKTAKNFCYPAPFYIPP